MTSKNSYFIFAISFFVVYIFFFSPCLSEASATKPIAPENICNSTLYPIFCKSLLPHNVSWNPHDYCRFSIQQSLSKSQNFIDLISKYLQNQSNLPKSVIQALEDCQLLVGTNIDFLSNTMETLNSPKNLGTLKTNNDVQTLLSAILTNQQTCLDGLQVSNSTWGTTNELHTPLSDGTKMYSVSLALFTRAWVGPRKSKMWERGRKILLENPSGVLVNKTVVVNPDGSGNFTTINDAVNAAPNNTDIINGYFLIKVVAGVYEEYVNIIKNKKNLMMIGDGINQTVITGNRSVVDGWTTFNSATFIVVGQGFVAMNITFRNTAGAIKGQAVAVRNGADTSTFYNCSFEGYQDTLYTHSLRQFYRNCDIYGTVDFIFGNAAVVFQNCNIYARLPIKGQANEVTAQGRTDPNQNTGTSIHNCSVRAANDLASSNGTTKTYLGRPWKEYSRTVYIQSFIDGLIDPTGWDKWSGDFALATLYYAEYNNTGPGSNTSNRVTWPGYHVIGTTDAVNFTVSNFLLGDVWLSTTGVPYDGGLL